MAVPSLPVQGGIPKCCMIQLEESKREKSKSRIRRCGVQEACSLFTCSLLLHSALKEWEGERQEGLKNVRCSRGSWRFMGGALSALNSPLPCVGWDLGDPAPLGVPELFSLSLHESWDLG